MKVGIATVGSRGDVEPFVSLAHALRVAGHDVTLAAPVDATGLAAGAEVRFVPMEFDVHALMRSAEGQRWLAAGDGRAFITGAARVLSEARDTIGKSTLAAAEGADVLIAGIQVDDYALAVSQAYGVKLVLGYFSPWVPSADFPSILVTRAQLRPRLLARALNQLTHRATELVYWRGKKVDINNYRRSLGLRPAPTAAIVWAPRLGVTALHAYSTALVPRPRDWTAQHVITGFWRPAPEVRRRLGESAPPPALVDWLDAGPPPFFLGFGSMPILDPAPVVEMVVNAVKRTGARVLIGAGWTELADGDSLPDDIRVVDRINHDWLFPRCAGVVHHGGAGTLAAGLTAGRPTWVCSLFSDQPYWGARVTKLGVGGTCRFVDLDVNRLAEALRYLGRKDVQGRAGALGATLRCETGAANAAREIARVAADSSGRTV